MLGDEVIAVRLAGIFALKRLRDERLREYHHLVMVLLTAAVRYPAGPGKYEVPESKKPGQRPDIQNMMAVIGSRNEEQLRVEKVGEYRINLHEANLYCANLYEAICPVRNSV